MRRFAVFNFKNKIRPLIAFGMIRLLQREHNYTLFTKIKFKLCNLALLTIKFEILNLILNKKIIINF